MQQLRRLSRRRSARREEGRFVIDGPVLVGEALASTVAVDAVYAEPDAPTAIVDAAGAAGVAVRRVRAGVLDKVTDTVTSQGVAALAARPERSLDEVVRDAATGLSVVLAGIADPGNAGTILRVAEAAGARAVLFTGASVDPCNPKCVRASAGALFHVPVAAGGETDDVLDQLAGSGVRTAAAVVRGGRPYDEVDLTGPVALVLGSEAHGLAPSVAERVELALTIPMAGRSESLNVAMAGSVLAFEVLRQQRQQGRAGR